MLQETERFPRRGASLSKLILLVEGDPANAQCFLHLLTQVASFRVFWATNGRAAWHFTQHVKPQLLLLDYSLPDTRASNSMTDCMREKIWKLFLRSS